MKPGCDVVENVRGALTCHAAPSLYHNHYRFRHTVSAAKLNPALNVIVNRLNAGENAAKDTVEGEESWQAFLAATRQMPVGLFAGKFANSKGINVGCSL